MVRRPWTLAEDTLLELADRFGRTEAAVRSRAARLRALRLEGDVAGG